MRAVYLFSILYYYRLLPFEKNEFCIVLTEIYIQDGENMETHGAYGKNKKVWYSWMTSRYSTDSISVQAKDSPLLSHTCMHQGHASVHDGGGEILFMDQK
jgi:hypothetical protein